MKIKWLALMLLFLFQGCVSPKKNNPEELKKSAETFVLNWFKSFEAKKWDDFNKLFFDDAQLFTPANTSDLKKSFKSLTEYYTNEIVECSSHLVSMSTEILGPDAALVTVRYIETDKHANFQESFDYLDNYLLKMQDGNFKIKRITSVFVNPMLFSDKVDRKYQNSKAEPYQRFNGSLGQMQAISFYYFDDYKKRGVSLTVLGKKMGERFAGFWDQSTGFSGLAEGFVWNIQCISPNVEVLERDENHLKMSYENAFRGGEKTWNIKDEEILDYFRNAFSAIASHMGGTCSIDVDGINYILTLTRK